MTLRVLLVDDEALALERLQAFLSDIEEGEVVGMARDAEQAAAAIEALGPVLVMLDIQMAGKSGTALAAGLAPDARPEIIFVMAFEHCAPDTFEVEAVDYLLKPVRLDRLRQAITRARRRRDLRAAAERSSGGTANLSQSAASPRSGFRCAAQLMRVHRSAFVRPALVTEVQRLGRGLIALVLRDGAVVQVGPSYSKEILRRLHREDAG